MTGRMRHIELPAEYALHAIRTDAAAYSIAFPNPSVVYDSADFALLNAGKCDELHFVVFADVKERPRLGIILGRRGDELCAPFSAPFGSLEVNGYQRVEFYLEALMRLHSYAADCGCSVLLRLPPALYSRDCCIESQQCALATLGVDPSAVFYNYHYPTARHAEFEKHLIAPKGKHYRQALRNGFEFEVLGNTEADIERAYTVIRANRESHGYALRMTLDDVVRTSALIPATYLMLTHQGRDVAAVQAFRVNDSVEQIIYWGETPDSTHLRPMEVLAEKTFAYFRALGRETVDIGPASIGSDPTLGLCDFKARLGCLLQPKTEYRF